MTTVFDPMEFVVGWVAGVLEAPAYTYVPDGPPDLFAVVTRTGGEVAYPHDSPEFAVQAWARTDADAETAAYLVAIAATNPASQPADRHCNAVGTPTMYSYGREDGGWYVWQVTVPLEFNLLD